MNDQNAESLTRRATELAEHVGKLRIAIDSLARRAGRSEKVLMITVIGLVLDIFLSVAVMWAYHIQHEQSDQLAANQAQQEKIRNEAVCPMFALFLGSYSPESRPPEARKSYESAYRQMRTIYTNLACTSPIVPPRTTP